MLKITTQALTIVLLRATTHHAFAPNLHRHHVVERLNGRGLPIGVFSTTLSDSERDVASVEYGRGSSIDYTIAEQEDFEDFVETITRQILSDDDDDEPSTILTTNMILSILSYYSNLETVEGAETIEKILRRLETESGNDENFYSLHCGHYTIAVTAWSKSGHPKSAEKATQIVNRMRELDINLNEVTYNTWMNAYVIQNDSARVKEILQEMEEKIPDKMRVQDYNVLILANSRQGRAKEAEQIVKKMVDKYSAGKSLVLPDLISYQMLLEAWSKSNEEGRGVRAEKILDSIEERQISYDNAACGDEDYDDQESTTFGIYVAAMRAIIHSEEEDIIQRVENIYERIVEQGLIPDAHVYATWLDAYAIAHPADASKKVSEILALMEKNLVDISFEDEIVVYNTALKVLKETREPDSVAQAEEQFEKMKSEGIVDEVTYGTMIALHANNNGGNNMSSAKRAEELLKEMGNENSFEASTQHINSAMNSFIQTEEISKASDMLDKMEEEYKNGNQSMRPNVVSYATLMNGWVKSDDPDRSKKAEMVFDKMVTMFESGNEAAKPNFISYVTLVDCIVKSGEVGAAERVEGIVRNMYEAYKQGESDVKPNAQLISTVINCWSKSGDNNAGERAEMVLNWLIQIYEEVKDPELMPTAFQFTSAITAWGKSRKFGKAARAEAILNKMKSLYESGVIKSPPNAYCYTAVINACAYAERDSIEKRDALQVFVKTYKEIISEKGIDPNHITFATALTALRNLLSADEKRVAAVKTVFEKCTEMGMFDHLVARRLQSILDTEQLKGLVGDDKVDEKGVIDLALIPAEWTRNVLTKQQNNRKGPQNRR